MKRLLTKVAAYVAAILISLFFVYPFYWMVISSFRTQAAVLSNPLALWPEEWRLAAYSKILRLGGLPLGSYVTNSLSITVGATLVGVVVTALGAYALYRAPRLPLFPTIQASFLLTIMYPNMLLVMPLYFVMYYLGLLGTYVGIILSITIIPLVFFIFIQFFRTIPGELLNAATVDGANEFQAFRYVVVPIAVPIFMTAGLIAVLLNWKQWFQVLVISTSPESYTLPVALMSLNTEYGVDFQATMALASLTCLPIIVLFLLTQRRVMSGFLAGAVKG